MSARKFGKSWWADISYHGERRRIRSPENSKAGAEAFEALVRRRLARGDPMDGKKDPSSSIPLFKDFVKTWFLTYVMTNNKPSEQQSKKYILDSQLIPSFGNIRLDKISNYAIEEYKAAQQKRGLAPKTINNQLSVLGKSLRTAQEWGEIKSIPLIRLLKVPPQVFNYLTPLESRRLLDAVDNLRLKALILLALRTGLRLGELLGLRWCDVDLGKQSITVQQSIVRNKICSPKSNKKRHIPITDELYVALASLRQREGFVFGDGSEPASHRTLRRILKNACKDAGIKNIGWHTLRHTFASDLAAVDVSVQTIQELLGHSDIRTTMRYSHLAPYKLREAVEMIGIEKIGNRRATK